MGEGVDEGQEEVEELAGGVPERELELALGVLEDVVVVVGDHEGREEDADFKALPLFLGEGAGGVDDERKAWPGGCDGVLFFETCDEVLEAASAGQVLACELLL